MWACKCYLEEDNKSDEIQVWRNVSEDARKEWDRVTHQDCHSFEVDEAWIARQIMAGKTIMWMNDTL